MPEPTAPEHERKPVSPLAAPPKCRPSLLFLILLAARHTGDRFLEKVTRRELEEDHSIRVEFVSPHEEETVPS